MLVAFAAGALNAVAGGGSFLTFPALLFAGVAPIPANATSAVALWPGSVASAWGYREDLGGEQRRLVLLGVASVVGGLLGALLLLFTPERVFSGLVPWLLLAATLVFALGPSLTRRVAGRHLHMPLAPLVLVQLVVAVYGGYFGGGMGIMMLAAYAAAGMTSLATMNGIKTVMAALLNAVANVAFIVAGVVAWWAAVPMALGGMAGGYVGARASRKVEARTLRPFIVAVGLLLSAYFFWRGA